MVTDHEFGYGTSKTSDNGAVLHGNYFFKTAENLMQDSLIQRLDEPHIIMGRFDAFFSQYLECLDHMVARMAD